MKIPAGEVKVKVPVIFLKDPSLDSLKVRLELSFGEMEDFKPGIDVWTTFVITSTAEASQPSNWDKDWRVVFGKWGSVKMKFIIEYVGFTAFEETVDSGFRNYLKTKAAQKLLEFNNSDDPRAPLKEADGTYVAF